MGKTVSQSLTSLEKEFMKKLKYISKKKIYNLSVLSPLLDQMVVSPTEGDTVSNPYFLY